MRINARRLQVAMDAVAEGLKKQKVEPIDADVILEDSINGIRIDVTPHVWYDRERTGTHQDGEPEPVHLGYW